MQNYFDTIEAYLNGEMTDAERAAFELQSSEDENLAKALKNHLLARDAMEILVENDLRKELDTLRKNKHKNLNNIVESKQKNNVLTLSATYKRYFAVAASLLLLMGFFGAYWVGGQYSDAAIVADNYTAYEAPFVRGGEKLPLQEGLVAYNKGNFDEAVNYFSNIQPSDEHYSMSQFYLGQAFYRKGMFDESAKTFVSLSNLGDNQLREKSEWYALLSYLADDKGETTECRAMVSRILANENHAYYQKTKDIMDKLNSCWRKFI